VELTKDTLLEGLDLEDPVVRREIRDLLPAVAQNELKPRAPVDQGLVAELLGEDQPRTVGRLLVLVGTELVLDHALVEVDVSAVRLMPRTDGDSGRARLVFCLGRTDWTVDVAMGAADELPLTGTDEEIAFDVGVGFDPREWLCESGTRKWLHDWYSDYQVEHWLPSPEQLGRVREQLTDLQRYTAFVFASQLLSANPADATGQAERIAAAGGPTAWAEAEWDHASDRLDLILTSDGSDDRDRVLTELTACAQRVLDAAPRPPG
jgi:hypothetical protein